MPTGGRAGTCDVQSRDQRSCPSSATDSWISRRYASRSLVIVQVVVADTVASGHSITSSAEPSARATPGSVVETAVTPA